MKGTTLDAVVAMVAEVSPQLKAPLVLFTYYNPILRKGVDNFCKQIRDAGASGAAGCRSRQGEGRLGCGRQRWPGRRVGAAVRAGILRVSARGREPRAQGRAERFRPPATALCCSRSARTCPLAPTFALLRPAGLLVPDIPLEETGTVRAACDKVGLELVLLATPTTPKQRMADIARASQGFVYLVSVTGVTGVQERVASRVEGLIEQLHSVTDKSIAVGFGVSRPEQAKQIVEWGAEGVICGSALVRALGEAKTPEEGLQAMEQLAKSLRDAIPH